MTITPLWLTGFEDGLFDANTTTVTTGADDGPNGIGTTQSVQSVVKRSGNYALRVNPASAATGYWAHRIAGSQRITVRFYIRIDAQPSVNTIYQGINVAAITGFIVKTDSAGVVTFYTRAAVTTIIGTLSATIPVDSAFHLVELNINATANPWRVGIKIDSGAEEVVSPAVAAANIDQHYFGRQSGVGAGVGDYYYDDITIGSCTADTDYLGAGEILMYLPTSDGTHSTPGSFSQGDAGATGGAMANSFAVVDDAAPWTLTRSTTDNIAQRTANALHYIEVAPPASGALDARTANYVKAKAMLSSASTTGANTAAALIRNSAGTEVGIMGTAAVPVDMSIDSTNQRKMAIATAPIAGWTPTEIAALRWRFGYCTDGVPIPTCQALAIEVDYGPVVAATPVRPTQRRVNLPRNAPMPQPAGLW